jgi:hypothetical protein
MGRIRGWVKKLEREARREMFEVLQHDGTVKRFPASDGMDALLALIDGRDHPLAEAVRNSPSPEWERSFYNAFPINKDEVKDLSEQGRGR